MNDADGFDVARLVLLQARADRLGIVLGSLASGVIGYLILRRALPPAGSADAPVSAPKEGDAGSG